MGAKHAPAIVRFTAKYRITSSGCWEWTAGKHPRGYGQFYGDGKRCGAHRFSYIYHKGSIPEDKEIDHLCRNTSCVNPDHLEAVSHHENVLRGESIQAINARKKTCIRGHILDRVRKKYRGRWCSTCNRIMHSAPAYMEKRREKGKSYYEQNKERLKEYARRKYWEKKLA